MTDLSADRLTVTVDGRDIVSDASFGLSGGEFVVLLGPNGAGKTTLLQAALGLIKVRSGVSRLGGQDIRRTSNMDRARTISYLPQKRPLAWPNSVRDVVALGRYAHGVALGRLGAEDRRAVDRALALCDLTPLAARRTDTLSGGELARVHCARALATEAPLIVADEPVASLDPNHQFQIMALIRRFVDDGGGALLVLHDIALAARFADRLLWMEDSRIIADGPAANTLTAERIAAVYKVRARIEEAPRGSAVIIDGPV